MSTENFSIFKHTTWCTLDLPLSVTSFRRLSQRQPCIYGSSKSSIGPGHISTFMLFGKVHVCREVQLSVEKDANSGWWCPHCQNLWLFRGFELVSHRENEGGPTELQTRSRTCSTAFPGTRCCWTQAWPWCSLDLSGRMPHDTMVADTRGELPGQWSAISWDRITQKQS